jgi:lipid-A-disaccharide synthase
MKKIFLLAGEVSGDLHGAALAQALLRRRPDLELWGLGGPAMEAAGVRLILRNEEMGVTGLWEVLVQARRFLDALGAVWAFFRRSPPDLFVPIDYPDFNFRLLPVASGRKIPVVYYISPQVWAWRAGRILTLKRYVRRMVVIFPFEERLYRDAGVPVSWVGHPLLDLIPPAGEPSAERAAAGYASGGPCVALLPGSRTSEIRRIAPLLREVRERIDTGRRQRTVPPVRWIVGRAPGLPAKAARLLEPLLAPSNPSEEGAPPPVLPGVEAMRLADLSLVASGTVTLEACLLGRPVLVVYRMHPVTYAWAKRLVRVPHIAMANILAGSRLVPEFVQEQARPEACAREAERLLEDQGAREEIRRGLLRARASLGPPGAADRAAEAVLRELDAR